MLLFIIILVVLAYIWIQNQFKFFERLGFPYIKPSIPFGSIGNVGRTEHISDFLKQNYEKFKNQGPGFGLFIMTKPSFIPTDPDLVKDILVKHFEIFHQHGFDVDENVDPLSAHLFFIDGQPWKDLRAKLSPTFTSGRMKMMFPIVLDTADQMIEYLASVPEKHSSMEMKEVYGSFTTEVIANVAFGLEIKCHGHPDNDFRKMAEDVFHPSTIENIKQFFLIAFPKIAKILRMSFNTQKTTDFFIKIVRENMEYREKNNVRRNDFFQLLIDIKNNEGGLSFNEIAANSFVFFLAGFETSSSVMTFCTYELALNQDVQDRLRDEIEEVLERHNGEVTYDAIMEMKYLDMVFNETVRRHPIVDNQNRRSVKDYKIPNTNLVIPAGTHIMLPIVGLHNDERFYENPDKFDPERFTEENIKNRHPFSFIPFSEGPRICIGLRFGTMQAKLGLVKLLTNFKILPCEKTIIPMKYDPRGQFQSPYGGLWLKLEKIS